MNHGTTTPQERADAAFDRAQEEAASAITFDSILEELLDLSPAEKAAELRRAQRGERSLLMSDAWDRIMRRATGDLLEQAMRVAAMSPRHVELWDEAA